MNEAIPPVEPSNSSVSIGVAAAEAIRKYLEGLKDAEAKLQIQNAIVVGRALDVQDMLLVRLEEIHEQSGEMIRFERPPHITGITSVTLQLSLLSYLLSFGGVFLRGFMLYCVWLWFAVPLGAPDIHFAGGIALSVFTLLVLHRGLGWQPMRPDESERRQTSPTFMRRLLAELAQTLSQQFLLFGLAFLLHLATA